MRKDQYGIEIKVGDWVKLSSPQNGEYCTEHLGKAFTVKKIKTKLLYLAVNPTIKAYPESVSRVQPLTNQPSDFDNNYGGNKYVDVATSKQQLDFKIKELKERLSNATNEYSKKILQSDIDWEWTKYNKREQKQKETWSAPTLFAKENQ